ncbi:cholecystokinin a [Leucoraja erinacea]|uniref:cholecystokinin a n=1 Tax=Leucoraja erinaceus TaxID=7782 RepID=UPI0024590ADA|nr:cholecystokinin a [Leucoraja erinacea]
MNSGICVCVLLAVLSSGGLARPDGGTERDGERPHGPLHQRPLREAPYGGHLKPRLNSEQGPGLVALLNTYLHKDSTGSRAGTVRSVDAPHRITNRDYMGWMDFGRRGAEDYDYPS